MSQARPLRLTDCNLATVNVRRQPEFFGELFPRNLGRMHVWLATISISEYIMYIYMGASTAIE